MKKSLLSLIMLCISIISYSQAVGDTFVDNFITYEVTSVTPNEVEITGYNATGGTVVNIPSNVTNNSITYNVTAIGFNSFNGKGLTAVTFPNTVISIGQQTFANNSLTSVTLPNNVITIGSSAFYVNNLTHVTIPSSVTDIGFAAFRENPLATVTSQGTTPATIFMPGINDSFWNRAVIDLTIPSGTSSAYASGGWTGFNSVTEAVPLAVGDTFVVDFITYEVTSVLPDTVEAINYNTAGGSMVNIPSAVTNNTQTYSVTSIGNSAFFNNQLTSVIIPSSINSIGFQAFSANTSLSTVISLATTPPTIFTGGGGDTFGDGNGFGMRSNMNLILTGNTTDEYVTDSGALWTGFKMVFEATSATTLKVSDYDAANGTNVSIPSSITIPSVTVFNVTEIGQSAFANRGITGVTIPNSVTEIGISAFELNNLTSVTIPDNVTVIGTTAFATNAITNLSLGNNLDIIGIGAFVDNNLTDITIPSNVTEIGLLAFGNNSSLASVTSLATVPPTITTGTNDTFIFDRSSTALNIPPGTLGAYVTNPGALWTGFNPVTENALLSTTAFELANDIIVISTTNGIRIMYSSNVQLQKYTMYSITGTKVANGIENEISTSFLANGIYILKLDFDKGTVVKKVMVN